MANVKWNAQQQQAIDARNGTILVSAAAGSGKTAVLVERVIQMLTDKSANIKADQLLIVTFTNLAAEEMRIRINKRITQLLDQCTVDSNLDEEYLRNQQLLLERAHISTIDSFCKDIVKTAYTRFDISPDYRIGDNSELKALQCNAVEEVAQEYYLREDFKNIASLFTTSTNDNELKRSVINFYSFLSALPFPERWTEQTLLELKNSEKDVIHSKWINNIVSDSINQIDYISGLMHNNTELFIKMDSLDEVSQDNSFSQQFNSERELVLDILSSCKTFEEIQKALFDSKHCSTFSERLSAPRGLSDECKEIKDSYKSNRDEIKKVIAKLKSFYNITPQQLEEQLERIIADTAVMLEFMRDFTNKYNQLKKEKNLLDFADIERYTLLTLANEDENGEFAVDDGSNSIRYNITEQARALSKSFKQVIVDEYQDVNQLQDLIFKIISDNDKNLFVVGDVKQSIYGFRQAMPDIFINRKKYCSSAKNINAENIVLKKNYRSRFGVTDYVNFVFSGLMKKDLGNLSYEPEDYLVAGADYKGENECDVYLHLNNLSQRSKLHRDMAEARCVAKIIKDTVGKYNVANGDTVRKAEYKDIAILMRSVKNTNTFTEYLEEQGIPIVTETKASLLDCKEVRMIIDLLRVVDNPLQDIPLYSTLVSPMFGFTPQQIAQLRSINGRKGYLYKNILDASKNSTQIKAFADDIEYYREIAANNPTDQLINIIYRKTAITEFAGSLEDGGVVLNNLRLLYNYSKSFENEQNKGVSAFVRYIDRAEEAGAVLDAQTGANTDGNAVKIMTMHHSKGLEFPVCILANLGKSPVQYRDKLYFDRELGLGLQLKDTQTNAAYKSFPYLAVVNKMKQDSAAEELRVLYVALTRAREQLHLVGSYNNLPKIVEQLSNELAMYKGISVNTLIKHNTMLEWLICTTLLMKPQKGQRDNVLWKYASQGFKDNIAFNHQYRAAPYNDIFVETISTEIEEENQERTADDTDSAFTGEHEALTAEENKSPSRAEIDINKLDKRFNMPYPYQASVDVPSVVTPSSLTHSENRAVFLEGFSFEDKEILTAAQRGTAMHAFMEHGDLVTAMSSPQFEIKRLVDSGFLSEQQGQSINADYIKACLNTPIMQRYINSPAKYREVKFEVMVKADITGFENCSEEHLLRGSVDCAFEEDGQLVIIDYKTDRAKNMQQLKERYETQLKLYKIGLSATLHKCVKQAVIYSFYLNDYIEI